MRSTIQVIIAGILPLTGNGMLDLRKEPPFPAVLTPGWAAVATVDLERDIPHISRVFDFWSAHPLETVEVIIGQGRRWIFGTAHCLGAEHIHRGRRYTLTLARYQWAKGFRLGDVRQRKAA